MSGNRCSPWRPVPKSNPDFTDAGTSSASSFSATSLIGQILVHERIGLGLRVAFRRVVPRTSINRSLLHFSLDNLPNRGLTVRQVVKRGGCSLAFIGLLFFLLLLLLLGGELGLVVFSRFLLSLGHVTSSAVVTAQRDNHSKRIGKSLLPG